MRVGLSVSGYLKKKRKLALPQKLFKVFEGAHSTNLK
jgi:hypothetical protein